LMRKWRRLPTNPWGCSRGGLRWVWPFGGCSSNAA
jgi:hypothetical protein